MRAGRAWWGGWALLAVALAGLSWLRPIDHDESQYVAAASLTAHGLLPYRDYLYLQTPLQPWLFAPIAWAAGVWTWPALRVANALLGAATAGFVALGARAAGARAGAAIAAAGLMVTCDIFLFSIGTARNDALPAACYAAAIWLAMRAERGDGSRMGALAIGLLLGAAVAAKVSYAVPAATYGVYALAVRRHRPGWVAAGAVPFAALLAASAAAAPAGFWFGVVTFPSAAPAEYYWAAGRVAKLSMVTKALDTLKFLAIGPAVLALAVVGIRRPPRRPTLLNWLIVAGLVAAVLPTPTWRQYLLPLLPPLFMRLAQHWTVEPPGRAQQLAAALLALVGLAPTAISLATADASMTTAMREGRTLARAMDAAGIAAGQPVATLSPQFLPATGRPPAPPFAAGPFYFRSRALMPPSEEGRFHALSKMRLGPAPRAPVLVGGEGAWTSGDGALDAAMARWALRGGLVRRPLSGSHFTLYVPGR